MKTYDKKIITNEGQLSLCEARGSYMAYHFAGTKGRDFI